MLTDFIYLLFFLICILYSFSVTTKLWKKIQNHNKYIREIVLQIILFLIYLAVTIIYSLRLNDNVETIVINYLSLYLSLNITIFDFDYIVFRVVNRSDPKLRKMFLHFTIWCSMIWAIIFGIATILKTNDYFHAIPYVTVALLATMCECIYFIRHKKSA